MRLAPRPDLKSIPREAKLDYLNLENKYSRSSAEAFNAPRRAALLAAINVHESHQARDEEESMSAQQDLMSARQARNIPGLASAQHHPSIHGD
jgi:hypothetical protein